MLLKEKAKLFAETAHQHQMYGHFPYIYHLSQTAEIAEEIGFGEEIITACYLHDVIEDTPLSFHDVEEEFGTEIAEIVYAVTDELGHNRKERKERTLPKIKANPKAIAVKLCDRISNIRHSSQHDQKMLKMYKKEHLEFYTQLYIPSSDDLLEYAWIMLVKEMIN